MLNFTRGGVPGTAIYTYIYICISPLYLEKDGFLESKNQKTQNQKIIKTFKTNLASLCQALFKNY